MERTLHVGPVGQGDDRARDVGGVRRAPVFVREELHLAAAGQHLCDILLDRCTRLGSVQQRRTDRERRWVPSPQLGFGLCLPAAVVDRRIGLIGLPVGPTASCEHHVTREVDHVRACGRGGLGDVPCAVDDHLPIVAPKGEVYDHGRLPGRDPVENRCPIADVERTGGLGEQFPAASLAGFHEVTTEEACGAGDHHQAPAVPCQPHAGKRRAVP